VVYSNGETVLGADDKAGIAVILAALSGLKAEAIPHGPIEILFTVQEEVGLFGAKYLQAELKADFGYILDGDGPVGNIINRAPSKVDLDFVMEGKAAHAGRPDTGINAIVAASSAIARLLTGRIDAETTSNVGVISGGKARNIVPDRADVAVEVRSTDPKKLEREVQAVLTAFNEAVAAAAARLTVRREASFETFTIPETHAVVTNAFRAARSLGIVPRLWTSGGGMDANVFNLRGLVCVGLGIGTVDPHSPKEQIPIAQLETGVRFIEALLAEAVYR
jgi:tripeptide aminopeptidase